MKDNNWKAGIDYPEYMTKEALLTLADGYLVDGETPATRIKDIAKSVEKRLGIKGLAVKVEQAINNKWIGLSSPIWSNFGRSRGLPISCFGSYVEDSVDGFYKANREIAVMSALGGGTSAYVGDIRKFGSPISNSKDLAKGTMMPISIINHTVNEVSQGGVRKGMCAVNNNFSHGDILAHLSVRDENSEIKSITTSVGISKQDIQLIESGDEKALKTLAELHKSRNNKGFPYCLFLDNANNHESTPKAYRNKGIIKSTNLCSEIMLPLNNKESFVCCLSSLNLACFDEWKDTDVVSTITYILEAVLDEFIEKASNIKAMKRAVRFARKHRAIGIGTMGEHTYLQEKGVPFGSIAHQSFIRLMYGKIKTQATETSIKLADMFGACDVNRGVGVHMRHTTLLAIAPTTTNSLICGDVSKGIEPEMSNITQKNVFKVAYARKNKTLEKVLASYGKNDEATWLNITKNFGSVQQLDFLTDEDKAVFKTAYEISQFDIIKMASIRQKYICQGQSLNLFVMPNVSPSVRTELMLTAYYYGIKSLYYQYSMSIQSENKTTDDVLAYMNKTNVSATNSECTNCEG
jgi:ribonucleoside-diphosphate reductase alpha chain